MQQLDFELNSFEERLNFLNEIDLSKYTPSQLELAGSYLLWTLYPKKEVQHTPDRVEQISPESPHTLDYADIRGQPYKTTPTVTFYPKFDRAQVRKKLSPAQLADYNALWRTIDEYDYIIESALILQGRRTLSIRADLLDRIPEPRQLSLTAIAADLSPLQLTDLRRAAIELKALQYTWYDSISPAVYKHSGSVSSPSPDLSRAAASAFTSFLDISIQPSSTSRPPAANAYTIDFRTTAAWEALIPFIADIAAIVPHLEPLSAIAAEELIKTYNHYKRTAHLLPHQRLLIELREKDTYSNRSAADTINKEFCTTYKPPYISTIYHHQCLPKLAEAAQRQERYWAVEDPNTELKKCNYCGIQRMRSAECYRRDSNNSDGFSSTCKVCLSTINMNKKAKRQQKLLDKNNLS